jgi:hypothetical protein
LNVDRVSGRRLQGGWRRKSPPSSGRTRHHSSSRGCTRAGSQWPGYPPSYSGHTARLRRGERRWPPPSGDTEARRRQTRPFPVSNWCLPRHRYALPEAPGAGAPTAAV